jgi:cell division protein FtsB
MTQSSARTMPARSGQRRAAPQRRTTRGARERAAKNARKRWLILAGVVIIVVAAIVANVKPLTHLQDASGRLNSATAKVNDLKTQQAALQDRLAKLGEPGYLEELAREQQTYAKPGEDLYIVTPSAEGDGTATVTPMAGGPSMSTGAGIGATGGSAAGKGAATQGAGASAANSTAGSDGAPGAGAATDHPGPLERVLTAIRGVF